jgi:hypothetical protein
MAATSPLTTNALSAPTPVRAKMLAIVNRFELFAAVVGFTNPCFHAANHTRYE